MRPSSSSSSSWCRFTHEWRRCLHWLRMWSYGACSHHRHHHHHHHYHHRHRCVWQVHVRSGTGVLTNGGCRFPAHTPIIIIIVVIIMVMCDRFTYEVAPVFTLMEDVVLRRMLAKVGWEGGEGMFAPGTLSSCTLMLIETFHFACCMYHHYCNCGSLHRTQ